MRIVKTALGAALVVMTAAASFDVGALASDRDEGNGYGHADRCKILTVEVTARNRLVITGTGLAKHGRTGILPPKVSLGGAMVEVLSDPAPTSMAITADVDSLVEELSGPKNLLLEIKRSRRDNGCPSYLVTVIPREKKTVFVTSTEYDGAFSQAPEHCLSESGAARADCICNDLAAGASPPVAGQFVAWLSDNQFAAPERLPDDGGPWYNLDPEERQRVAATKSELPGCAILLGGYCIEHAVGFTENGAALDAAVWTGVPLGNPFPEQTCGNWESSSLPDTGWVGESSESLTRWTSGATMSCDRPEGHLYCFQR